MASEGFFCDGWSKFLVSSNCPRNYNNNNNNNNKSKNYSKILHYCFEIDSNFQMENEAENEVHRDLLFIWEFKDVDDETYYFSERSIIVIDLTFS